MQSRIATDSVLSHDGELEEVRGAQHGEGGPDRRRHQTALRVSVEAWLGQDQAAAASLEDAAAGAHDVLHPLGLRTVGQRDHDGIASPEGQDGRPVGLSGPAPRVDDLAEAGKPQGHGSQQGVRDASIEAAEPMRKGHAASADAPSGSRPVSKAAGTVLAYVLGARYQRSTPKPA